jgi:hypothetical protein
MTVSTLISEKTLRTKKIPLKYDRLIGIRIEDKDFQALEYLCEKNSLSRARFIRRLIHLAVSEEKEDVNAV